jgi:hypothetical protein
LRSALSPSEEKEGDNADSKQSNYRCSRKPANYRLAQSIHTVRIRRLCMQAMEDVTFVDAALGGGEYRQCAHSRAMKATDIEVFG